jgi:spermidine synthase
LFFFPGRNLQEIMTHAGRPIVLDIFIQLSLTIGLAFFVLSTISIVAQSWLAHSDLPESRNPYILYAVSNVGSFLGLLSYPFLFELYLDLDTQVTLWRILYLIFIVIYLVSMVIIDYSDRDTPREKFFDKSIFLRKFSFADEAVKRNLYWFLLSAAGCIIFLSVTNIITYEIAPCPLLWIIPLCIYLLSFVFTFRDKPIYPVWITEKFHLVIGFSVIIFFFAQGSILPISPQLIAFFLSLFALCMFCQHALYESRPMEKKELTGFYLIISFGGFAGSLVVTWLAPVFFTSPFEFLFGLLLIGLAMNLNDSHSKVDFYSLRFIAYVMIFIFAWPVLFKKYNVLGVLLIFVAIGFAFRELNRRKIALGICLLTVMIASPFAESLWSKNDKNLRSFRNYYGIYKINAWSDYLILMNGTTCHGAQHMTKDKAQREEPLTYYHKATPVSGVLSGSHFSTQRIAVVGLGIGTLSVFGKKGEYMDFFELDPDMASFVNLFDFLQNSKAKLNFFYDDARIALRKMPKKYYDIIIIDAFSGDSVPFHLLTTDAILEYKEHLKDKGLIMFHISNRYLNIEPVLVSNALYVNAFAQVSENDVKGPLLFASKWMALTWDKQIHHTFISELHWQDDTAKSAEKELRPWTDKYSNIPSIMKVDILINSIKSFTPFSW